MGIARLSELKGNLYDCMRRSKIVLLKESAEGGGEQLGWERVEVRHKTFIHSSLTELVIRFEPG